MNWNTKTTISAIIALIIIAIVTGLPVFWIALAAVIVLISLAAPALLQNRRVQIAIGILVVGGLLWNPIIKTWGYVSPKTAGKTVSVLEKEFGTFIRTEMRGDDLVTYEYLSDQINVAENNFRNSIVPQLNPNSANYDTELDKLKNAHAYYEQKREQLRELFNVTTTLDLFLLYFRLLLYIAIIMLPFYGAKLWQTALPEELKSFLWKLPAFMAVAGLMQAALYFAMPTSWQKMANVYVEQIIKLNFSHNPVISIEIAILILCIAIAVRESFPKLKNWAILFLIIGLMSTLYMWTGFNPANIWQVDFNQIANGKLAIKKEVNKLFDPVKRPVIQKTNYSPPPVQNPTIKPANKKMGYMTQNGNITLLVTKRDGVTIPAGQYLIKILDGQVRWTYNKKKFQKLNNGQKLTLTSTASFFAVGKAKFQAQKQ